MQYLRKESIFIALTLSMLCIQFDSFAIALSLDQITYDLGTSHQMSQWIISIYLFGVGLSMLPSGIASDLFGCKRMMTIGTFGFAMSTLVCTLVNEVYMLILWRFIQGVSAGILVPAGIAYLCKHDEHYRLKISIAMGTGYLAMALGPVVGAMMVKQLNWQAVFGFCVPFMVIATIFSMLSPQSEEPKNEYLMTEFKTIFQCLSFIGGTLVILLSPLPGLYVFFICTICVVAIGYFRTLQFSMLKTLLNRIQSLPTAYFMMTLLGSVSNILLLGLIFSFPLIFQNFYKMSIELTGIAFLTVAVCVMAGSFCATKLGASYPIKWTLIWFGLLSLLYAYIILYSDYEFITFTVVYHIIAFVLGLTNAITLVGIQDFLEPHLSGFGTGLFKTLITSIGGMSVAVLSLIIGQEALTIAMLQTLHEILLGSTILSMMMVFSNRSLQLSSSAANH